MERKEICLTPFRSLVEWWDVHPGQCGTGAFPGKESSVKTQLGPFGENWSWWQGVAFAHIHVLCVSIPSCGRKEGSNLVPSALHP